jgi:hypothetical protein
MTSLPLFVFLLFVIPTIGMGLALFVAVLHRVPRFAGAATSRSRRPLPRHTW